jgi:phage N-6-adenine-methyltransferase
MSVPTTRTLGKDDWMTPSSLFDQVHDIVDFDLDACASDRAASRLDTFIDPGADALAVRWARRGKRVWVNPPYGRDIKDWFAKAGQACESGCETVCLLAYANTDTTYWQRWVAKNPRCLLVVFLSPRVHFVRPDGEKATGAPKGSALIFFTPVDRPGAHPKHAYWNYKTEDLQQVLNATFPNVTIGATT